MDKPFFDIWICQGRMCTALGADALSHAARAALDGSPDDAVRCRLLRGGCYGLCELSPNVVLRRWPTADALPDPSVDRLTRTGQANETVYSRLTPAELARVLEAHLQRDEGVPALTRAAREASIPPRTSVAERIRALREKARRSG